MERRSSNCLRLLLLRLLRVANAALVRAVLRRFRLGLCGGLLGIRSSHGWVRDRSAATGALVRSQFRPKLRYRTPARGMGVQRAKKTQGGFGPPSFVHAARSPPEALRRSRA